MYRMTPQKGMVVHNAVILYIVQTEKYHLFSGNSDEWRLSTPITRAKNDVDGDAFQFVTESGSSYLVKNDRWNLTSYMAGQLQNFKQSMDFKIVANNVKEALAIVDMFPVEE